MSFSTSPEQLNANNLGSLLNILLSGLARPVCIRLVLNSRLHHSAHPAVLSVI